MFNRNNVVIEFGSQNITVLVGKESQNSLIISASAEMPYGGFLNGEFLELEKLGSVLKQVISKAEQTAKMSIREVYIGVPPAFSTIKVKNVSQNFDKKIKLTEKVLNNFYFIGNDFAKFNSHEVISTNIVGSKLDDGETYTDIIGKSSSSMEGKIAYILCDKSFMDIIRNLLKMIGVKIKAFLSSSLAESKYLLQDNIKDAIIMDIGHITSSVNFMEEGSLVAMNEFSSGGGFITSDLMNRLGLSYETADNLKKKVVLSFSPQGTDVYEVKNKNEILELSAGDVNNIVRDRVYKILKSINKSMQLNSNIITEQTKLYLTGGGISYIRGIKDIISNAFETDVEIVFPKLAQIDKPHYLAEISLLYLACRYKDLGIKL